jgi:hypothetical protein
VWRGRLGRPAARSQDEADRAGTLIRTRPAASAVARSAWRGQIGSKELDGDDVGTVRRIKRRPLLKATTLLAPIGAVDPAADEGGAGPGDPRDLRAVPERRIGRDERGEPGDLARQRVRAEGISVSNRRAGYPRLRAPRSDARAEHVLPSPAIAAVEAAVIPISSR